MAMTISMGRGPKTQLPRRLRDLEAKYGETEVPKTGSAQVYRKEHVAFQLAIEKSPWNSALLARLCWLDPSIKQSKGGINVIQFSVYTLELENKNGHTLACHDFSVTIGTQQT